MLFEDNRLLNPVPPLKIKLCGFSEPETTLCAVEHGVDAIGLIFHESSVRFVSINQAQAVARAVNGVADLVGVFVNASRETIQQVRQQVPLTAIQFHGDETIEFCSQWLDIPWIKAIRVNPEIPLAPVLKKWQTVSSACLLDTQSSLYGGSGTSFDWSLIPRQYRKQIILSGGLNVEKVSQAIRNIQPFAIDISSGIEESPGIKSCNLIKVLLREAHYVI